MLTRFGFRRKMLYLCTSDEERAYKQRVFSSFFGLKDGEFTSEVEKFTLLRKIFLGVCGKFSRNVGSFFADIEHPKVKRYLFSWSHFFGGGEKIKENIRGGESWSSPGNWIIKELK